MAFDLFGKSMQPLPNFHLSLHQKRQTLLLHRWTSFEYLLGLKLIVDDLISGASLRLADAKMDGRDAVLASERWGVRDTSSNWSTFAFPALIELQQSLVEQLALRIEGAYSTTGYINCGRMLSEFSLHWMTPAENSIFDTQWRLLEKYAGRIDDALGNGRRKPLNDISMIEYWGKLSHLFPKFPLMRVRTDIEGESGEVPPRTGVYVSQDDPNATLQFAWTHDTAGRRPGRLCNSQTFNRLGLTLLREIGRKALWLDAERMAPLAWKALQSSAAVDFGPWRPEDIRANDLNAMHALAFASFTERPCKWYFVELIEGEFDDDTQEPTDVPPVTLPQRCEAGQPCPREGFWSTAAAPSVGSRLFKLGDLMPEIKRDYGKTIWQWSLTQSPLPR